MAQNITREQLVNLIDQFARSQFFWNDCVASEDRGPNNYALMIVVYDDGLGFLADYQRGAPFGGDDVHYVNEQRHFANAEECADVLIEMHGALDMPE